MNSEFKFKVLRKIKVLGIFLNWIEKKYDLLKHSSISTHMTRDEKLMLFWLVKQRPEKIKNLVEIGSYLGASSSYLAAAACSDAKVICVDTWGNHAMEYISEDVARDGRERNTYEEFRVNTQLYKDKIVPVRGWSSEMLSSVQEVCHGQKVDFLFIDGDHSYEGVKKDWDIYSPLLKQNAFVAFHDTGWAEGVRQVINESVKQKSKCVLWLPNLEVYQITN